MSNGIEIRKIWEDDHMVELEILSSDGVSTLSTKVYTQYEEISKIVSKLEVAPITSNESVSGFSFGEFGPEWGSGAVEVIFLGCTSARLGVMIKVEGGFEEFFGKMIAYGGNLHFHASPVLYDEFVSSLKSVSLGEDTTAKLERF